MHSTYIIAEMACSHEGDQALARKIIDWRRIGGRRRHPISGMATYEPPTRAPITRDFVSA